MESNLQQPAGTTGTPNIQPHPNKMINGGILALFIIVGGIIGSQTAFPFITGTIVGMVGTGLIPVLLLIVVFVIIGALIGIAFKYVVTEVNAITYVITIISCIVFPLIGGMVAYILLKRRGLTQ
jgi:uncharacterized membrane protein AbrB (regulator of aidB expression)